MSSDLAKMLKAKRDLLLALSHELKSPLARSRVSIELLDPSPTQKALLNDQKQIERLIDEVFESERAHPDHALLHRQRCDLETLVNDVVNNDLDNADINTHFQGPIDSVMIDSNQVRRLIRNLLENALRYNRDTHGKVALHAYANAQWLTIQVRDHGKGIDAEHLGHLTEAFYRADPSRTGTTGGLGLGLYLCQNIVDAHGGQINIESELDKGTVVHVQLALK